MARRILIIEDDPMNAKLFEIVLTRKGGFQVQVTEDPSHVLREARSGSVDLIIMDISLSNSELDGRPVDGLEITRQLKGDPRTRDVPILLATAHAMKGSREKFLRESGADDYVSKPIIDSDELIQRVESLITRGSHAVSPVDR